MVRSLEPSGYFGVLRSRVRNRRGVDAAGRLVEVNTPGGTTEYAYYPWGSRAAMTLPNDVETTYTYDGLLRKNR